MEQAIAYAKQRRDNVYVLYTIHSNQNDKNYSLTNAQYFMGKWHEAMDHHYHLERLNEAHEYHVDSGMGE